MTDKPMDLNDIASVRKAAEEILYGKEFFVATAADRLIRVSQQYPHDQAVSLMANALTKRFEKNGSMDTMNQSDFQALYDEVGGLGDRGLFREHFSDLLINAGAPNKVAHYNPSHTASIRDSGDSLDLLDSEVISEYESLFRDPSEKISYAKFVEQGKKSVAAELLDMNLSLNSVEVAAKDSDFVVYAAEVNTKAGTVPFLIPAEIVNSSVLLPSVFVAGNEFRDLTKTNLVNYINSSFGEKTISPNVLLEALSNAKFGSNLSKHASDSSSWNDYNSFEAPSLYAELADEGPAHGEGLDFEKVAVPEPLQGITDDLVKEVLYETGLSFDRDVVLKAKKALATELKSMGFTPDKIKISSEFSEGIVLSTAIVGKGGKKTIEVPVEISNDKVLIPSTFTSGAVAKKFDEASLKSFADHKEEGDFNALMSDNYDMSFNELYNKAMQNAGFGNFLQVEECLAVIESKFGPDLHKLAFDDLMGLVRVGFNSKEKSPLDAIDQYIKEASDQIKDKESYIKLSDKINYLYPKD